MGPQTHSRKIGLAASQGGELFEFGIFADTLVDLKLNGKRSLGVEILYRSESSTFWIFLTLGRVYRSQLWSYRVLGPEFEEFWELMDLYSVGG